MEAFPSCPTREPSGNSEKTFGARGPPQLGEGESLGLGAGCGVFEVPQQFHCEAELRHPPLPPTTTKPHWAMLSTQQGNQAFPLLQCWPRASLTLHVTAAWRDLGA